MPRLRLKQMAPVRFAPPNDLVYAITDVTRGLRRVRRGEPLRRDDPMVVELPDAFEVRYRLSDEINQADEEVR